MSETVVNEINDGFSESFYITIIGVAVGALTGFLGFILKSRCTRIKCCGLECERSVVSEENLRNVTVDIPTSSFNTSSTTLPRV